MSNDIPKPTKLEIEAVENQIKEIIRWPERRNWESKKDQRIKSLFGADSFIIAQIWMMIDPLIEKDQAKNTVHNGAEQKHLLYALCFLKVYGPNEEVHCAILDWPHSDTFRKWSWYIIDKIFSLQNIVINLHNRFSGYDICNVNTDCLMTLDGMDIPCCEPHPFNKGMYSQKHNGPGIQYQIAICIKTGWIVWIHGPFAGGICERTVFMGGLNKYLLPGEFVEADQGFTNVPTIKTPGAAITSKQKKQKSVARSRHECIQSKFKVFNVMNTFFHHMAGRSREIMMEKHGKCFAAVAVITQLKIMNGEKTFDVDYDVRYDSRVYN